MVRRFVDCHVCARLVHEEDASCPFCGAAQRRVGAPVWISVALVAGLALAETGCDAPDHGPPALRELGGSSTGTTDASASDGSSGSSSGDGSSGSSSGDGSSGSSSSSGPGGTGTTIDDNNSSPDGASYAGPDAESNSNSDSATSDLDSTSFPMPDGATYAGPDENASLAPTDSLSDGAAQSDSSGEDADGDAQSSGKDACACSGPSRPRSELVTLLLLGLLRRRSR